MKKAAVKKPPKAAPLKSLKELKPANESQAELVDLLRGFDDIGVSIVEEQWRTLTPQSCNQAISWLKSRQAGQMVPLPLFLEKFATKELVDESKAYQQEQEKLRKVLFPCEFGKPSVQKPTSDGEERIKMTVVIPINAMQGSTAEACFGYKKLKVEFSRRPMSEWGQKHIMEDGLRRTIVTEADVSGFSRTRHNRKFGFLVDQNDLSISDAFEEFWGNSGSCRVEVLGEIKGKEEDEPVKPVARPPLPGQKTLPMEQATKAEDGEQEYTLASMNDFEVSATLFKNKDGWFCDIGGVTPDGDEFVNYDLGRKKLAARVSAREAMSARVGQIIDYWEKKFGKNKDCVPVISWLKGWLSHLTANKEPAEVKILMDKK